MISRIMLIGPKNSGKTTLAKQFNAGDSAWESGSSQAVQYGKFTIEMPSGYLECPYMYDSLIATGQDAAAVFFLVDPLRSEVSYPPGFSTSFQGAHCGVITKVDMATFEQIERARWQLSYIGLQNNCVLYSSITGDGLEELLQYKQFCKLLY